MSLEIRVLPLQKRFADNPSGTFKLRLKKAIKLPFFQFEREKIRVSGRFECLPKTNQKDDRSDEGVFQAGMASLIPFSDFAFRTDDHPEFIYPRKREVPVIVTLWVRLQSGETLAAVPNVVRQKGAVGQFEKPGDGSNEPRKSLNHGLFLEKAFLPGPLYALPS